MTSEITILELVEMSKLDPSLVLEIFKNHVENGKSILPSSVYNIFNKTNFSISQLTQAKMIMSRGFLLQEKLKNEKASLEYQKSLHYLARKITELKNAKLFIRS